MSYISEITRLFNDEFKVNILFIIDIFGPLNLQTMHELLDKPKSTILGHLREMVNLGQIELDSELTMKKTGKFYTLTQSVKDLLDSEDDTIRIKRDTLDELGIPKEEFVKSVANLQRSIGFQANLLAQLNARYLEENINLFKNVEENKKKLMGFFASTFELAINSEEDYNEIQNYFQEFSEKLKKFDASKRKKTEQTLLMFLLTSPKDQVGPSK